MKQLKILAQIIIIALSFMHLGVFAVDAQSQLADIAKITKTAPSSERGQIFFTSKHGGEWTCASCHGAPPTAAGKHVTTGKSIGAMAPAFNPERFTDVEKSEKWFRRNCKDVLSRECTVTEKADVLAYLISIKK